MTKLTSLVMSKNNQHLSVKKRMRALYLMNLSKMMKPPPEIFTTDLLKPLRSERK
jgi:hypothetical protein